MRTGMPNQASLSLHNYRDGVRNGADDTPFPPFFTRILSREHLSDGVVLTESKKHEYLQVNEDSSDAYNTCHAQGSRSA